MNYFKEELNEFKMDFGLLQKQACTGEEEQAYTQMWKEQKPLPDDVVMTNHVFYKLVKGPAIQEEVRLFLLFRQIKYLKTIKNCLIFFVVLLILSIFVVSNGNIIFS